jgi:hypothetical protein
MASLVRALTIHWSVTLVWYTHAQPTSSDHHALLITLQHDFGSWTSGQHKPISVRQQLNLTELDNLSPIFQQKLEEACADADDLEKLELAMFKVAAEVYGLKPAPTGARPFISHAVLSSRRSSGHSVNSAVTTLTMSLRRYHQLISGRVSAADWRHQTVQNSSHSFLAATKLTSHHGYQ